MTASLLTADEVAAMLKIEKQTLAKWRCISGGPVFVKVGRSVRYRAVDVETWLADRSHAHTSLPVGSTSN